MKILRLTGNYGGNVPQATVVTDSAIVRPGKPMFLPRWAETFVGIPAFAFRIGRLGKTISRRFASRYCDGMSVALMVEARGIDSRQPEARYSALATAFDGALLPGQWHELAPESLPAELEADFRLPSGEQATITTAAMTLGFDLLVEWLSRYFTLKMGDMIVSDCAPLEFPLHVGDVIEASLGSEPLLRARIK
ncbi:MAG: fumarylacetoacetate hydrolase family protein [Muribaculaceae bacterium]|nr:fumarylacetoacetate hydrolase family protein [Muribaculaceae bacterium]